MTQRSAILQKKLQELESELADIYRLPPAKTPPVHQTYFDDVEQRIEFLKTLYSAEIASQPQNTDQLLEIGERLAAVEAAFREWNASRTSAMFKSNLNDTLSVCSDCTQALLLDDACESDSPGKFFEKSPANLVFVKESPEKAAEKEEAGGRFWGQIVRYCGVFGGGIIFGAICVGKYVAFSDFAHYEVFGDLPPT